MRGPSHTDSLYRSSHFALDPLLDHFQRKVDRSRSRELITGILRKSTAILAVVLFLVLVLRSRGSASTPAPSQSQERTLHCFFLLDRSGSMKSLAAGAIAGFNHYVKQQQAQGGRMLLTLAQFDDQQPFQLVFEGRDIHQVSQLRLSDFKPRGRTPLYDSLAELILHADKHSGAGVEVVLVVFSDGLENASRRHTRSEVFGLVEQRRKGAAGWTFVFLGANQARGSSQGRGFGGRGLQGAGMWEWGRGCGGQEFARSGDVRGRSLHGARMSELGLGCGGAGVCRGR